LAKGGGKNQIWPKAKKDQLKMWSSEKPGRRSLEQRMTCNKVRAKKKKRHHSQNQKGTAIPGNWPVKIPKKEGGGDPEQKREIKTWRGEFRTKGRGIGDKNV